MQKQLDRMNKAREEKERVKKMTERGIPKSTRQVNPQPPRDGSPHGDEVDKIVGGVPEKPMTSARGFTARPVPNPVRSTIQSGIPRGSS